MTCRGPTHFHPTCPNGPPTNRVAIPKQTMTNKLTSKRNISYR